jgi:tetratricopeptide (TPR) repeat protein
MSVLFGNEIASSKLKDHNQAVEIAKLGLISHPNDPQLLNNIIYSLCVQNKMEDAEKYLSSVRKEDMSSNDDSGICLTATKGLYFFRKGYHEMGRQLYLESIKMAKETGSNYLNSLALVNFIREELLLGQEDVTPIIPNIERIAKHYTGRNISEDANEVIELFKRKQLAGNNFDISSTPIT